uniref:F-box domain-containing protein n=1 Tax=Psilocybe cubensis TaxID=181762 RepID=A0A8H7XQL2_PSICU
METKSNIPSEIYEAILNNLHDDKESLVNCALISRQFTYRSQRLLFKRVVLDSPFQRSDKASSVFSPAETFLEAINHSPHLCRLVVDLQISDQRESSDPEWTYSEANSWIRQDLAIAKILPLLSELENFSIIGHGYLGRLNFNCWTEDLQSAILSKIPALRTLTLDWIRNVPLLILSNIPHLETLHFSNVNFNTDFPPAVEPLNTTKLTNFYYNSHSSSDWPTLYPWLQSENCTVNLKQLTHISMIIDTPMEATAEDVHSMSQVLRGCANTLKYLHICFSSNSELSSSI